MVIYRDKWRKSQQSGYLYIYILYYIYYIYIYIYYYYNIYIYIYYNIYIYNNKYIYIIIINIYIYTYGQYYSKPTRLDILGIRDTCTNIEGYRNKNMGVSSIPLIVEIHGRIWAYKSLSGLSLPL